MSHMQVQPIMDRVVCAVVEKDQKKKACVSGPAQFTLLLVKGQLSLKIHQPCARAW